MNCAFCGSKIEIKGPIGRKDACPKCGHDLRCCKQCKFYDPHAYNDCREVSAERIRDKERANFCDYFLPRGSKGPHRGGGYNTKRGGAMEALEALFKKK